MSLLTYSISQMLIKGKVHKFGDNINTDEIIAARYLNILNPQELGKHCMESIDKNFSNKVKKNDIIVAGGNFGCGSSREHAPLAIKGVGISCVIAESFARIFFRNAINTGLVILEVRQAQDINKGDILKVDLIKGEVSNLTQNQTYQTQPFPRFLQEIIRRGGLMNYVKRRHNLRNKMT